jgi:hypothetical protein
VVWLVIALALAARAAGRPPTRGVLIDHLEFGRRLLHGEHVYAVWRSDPDAPPRPLHAPYPPSFGLLTAPFHVVDAAFGLRAARLAWVALQLASLAAAAFALRSLLAPRAPPGLAHDDAERSRWHWLWLLALLATLRFVLRDTHGGGGNLVNVALAVLAFRDAERGRELRAGAWLACSLLTKPTLVWLVPVLALFGRWRTLRAAAAFGAGGLLLTLALQRFDVASWTRWLQGSLAMATQRDAWAVPQLDFPPFEWMNQALRYAVARWLGDVPPELAAKVPWGVTPGAGLPPPAVARLATAASAALLAALVATAWRVRRHARARVWAFAATLVVTLLLSPISWKAHHVALLPLLLLVLERTLRERRRSGWMLLGGWIVGCALPGGDVVGDDADEWLNSVYVVTAWDVVLFVHALLVARALTRGGDGDSVSAAGTPRSVAARR